MSLLTPELASMYKAKALEAIRNLRANGKVKAPHTPEQEQAFVKRYILHMLANNRQQFLQRQQQQQQQQQQGGGQQQQGTQQNQANQAGRNQPDLNQQAAVQVPSKDPQALINKFQLTPVKSLQMVVNLNNNKILFKV
ncbi:unnamed protein product [[Candida] boidinii]|nr:unnamed protein product [[Candida] boidinii]